MIASYRMRLLASTLLIGMSAPAFAQTAVPVTGTPDSPQYGPAQAQTEETVAQDDSTGDIVVTGTLIRNPNLISSNPVNVIGENEIQLRQIGNAEQLVRDLPGVVPSIGSSVNNGNGGASYVDLRGLGFNRNLVLLDGSRISPASLAGAVDLNNIPVALVQRVDVLTGGASTTYGADAVSGVVNYITRSDFAGVDLQVTNGITERGDGANFRVDATIGANFDDGRGNAVFSIGYQEADPIYQGARDFSNVAIDSFTGASGGSGTSVPVRVNIPGVGNRQINPATGQFNPTAAFTAYNFNPFNIFQTPIERYNMYGAANYKIADEVEIYTRGLFSRNTVSTIIAPSGQFGTTVNLPLSNPFLPVGARNTLCGAIGLDAATCAAAAAATGPNDPAYRTVATSLFRRAVEAGPRVSDYRTTVFDYRLGVRGDIGLGLSYDLFGAYGESENNNVQQGYTLDSRARQGLLTQIDPATGQAVCVDQSNGCVPVNFFGAAGSQTPEMVAFLTANSQSVIRTTLSQVRGTLQGEFFGLTSPYAEEPISFAVGGEYRRYSAEQESDLLSQSGDLGGAGGAAPNINGGYDVYEAIGELIVPLVANVPFFQSLQLEGGVRYSSYTVDTPSQPTFDTWTYKGGLNWQPFDGLRLRGNYARAVRAPNIAELFNPLNTNLTNSSDDPCANIDDNGAPIPGRPVPTGALRDVCIAQGAPAALIGSIAVPTAGQANFTGGGNPDLSPETSDSWSVGGVVTPRALPGFSASVDYYHILIRDAITTPTPGDALNACFSAPSVTNPACQVIGRNPLDGSLSGDYATTSGLFLPLSNLGRLKTDGIDVTVNYSREIGSATVGIGFVGNWTNRSEFQATPTSINRDCVGLYSENCPSIQPEFQWSTRGTVGFGNVDLSLLWRHLDSVEYEFANDPDNAAFSGPVPALGGSNRNFNRIEAADYFDLTLRVEASENFTFTISAINLLDRDPPVVGNSIGDTSFNSGNTYPSTYDALGRRFAFGTRIRF